MQDPFLFSGTIESNLAHGVLNHTNEDLDRACKLACCYDFIHDSRYFPEGYKSELLDRGVNLSGGQKQRIAIARALMKKCKILIFDEATSALDANSEKEVQNAIDLISREGRITTIIIAHRLSTVKNCDKIFVLKDGSVVEQGNHSFLIGLNGVYRQLVDKQLETFRE